MEIWLSGQPDIYSLEGKTAKAKDDFAIELRKMILKEKENTNTRLARMSHSACQQLLVLNQPDHGDQHLVIGPNPLIKKEIKTHFHVYLWSKSNFYFIEEVL